MSIFNFFKNSEKDPFRISEQDRLWVEENFKWLIKVFGYPNKGSQQILIQERFFPRTFTGTDVAVEHVIDDLCSLLEIQRNKVSFEIFNDLRDNYGIAYEIEGNPFDSDLEIENGNYKILVANYLHKHPNRLIFNLVYEVLKIKLTETKSQFDTGEDTALFIYLAGVYLGFGVLLSQNLQEIGRTDDGFWETQWNYVSEMPDETMAFALATYSKLIEEDAPTWKNELPYHLIKLFDKAIKYITENPSQLYDEKELEANELFKTAHELYLKNNFEEAISNLQHALLLTNDELLKADVYNNLGYNNIRLKKYEQSIPFFKKSIQIIDDYGYANDNLGYAFIQTGNLEEGKKFLDKALLTENNDIAYTYRNLALYFAAKGEISKAEEYFQKSFESKNDAVDLLEYHYALFLMNKGEKEKGIKFLKIAVEKGEPEAIEKLNS